MTKEIVEAETNAQSSLATPLKEQKHADPKTAGEIFHINATPLLHGQQQSLGNAYASNINGPLHLMTPDHDSHAHDHEKHKHDHTHKQVPDHPVAFEEYGKKLVGHSENMAAPPHQLNRM